MKINDLINKTKEYIVSNNYNVFDIAFCTKNQNVTSLDIQEKNELPDSYSVAKSFCVCAIGMLYDEGKIDLNDHITDILRKYIDYDYNKIWDSITIHDCLTHHLGIKEAALDIDAFDKSEFGDDYLKYTLNLEFVHEPRKEFVYTDAAYYLISRIVCEIASEDVEEYLKRKLFKYLDINDYSWTKCPFGYSMGATGLYMKSSDTVKLSALYLNNGVYKGNRLLSKEWMKIMEDNQYEDYFFKNNGWRAKGGMLGQLIMYNRDKNCAFSMHGIGDYGDKVMRYVMSIVNEEVEDN